MTKVQPFVLRGSYSLPGLLIPALVLIPALAMTGCTGAGSGEAKPTPEAKGFDDMGRASDATAAKDGSAAQDASAGTSAGQEPQEKQGQGDIAQQRQREFVNQTVKEARRSLELKLFDDARRLAAQALDVDPSSREAREILLTADELLGRSSNRTVSQRFDDLLAQGRVREERDRFQAESFMHQGDAHVTAGRFDDAIEAYQRAQLTLRYSPAIAPGSQLEKQLDVKLQDAKKAKAKADTTREEEKRNLSRRELEEEERKQRLNTEAKVHNLMLEANYAFQNGNYQRSVTLIDEILRLQPTNSAALAMHDLAERARHDNALDSLRQDWKREWSKTFDELQSSDLTQTESIKFDLVRWAEVKIRKPMEFSTPEELDSPEEKAILDRLQNTRLEHRFAKADVEAWASYYAKVTEVNFFVTKGVTEMDAATTTLTDFTLPASYSVYQALNVISAITGVKWKIQNGVVQLVTADKATGRMFMKPYDVRDLVNGVKDMPGRDLKLTIPGESETPPADEEAKPTVVDENKLMDTIKNTIDAESWTGGEATISPHKGVIMIRQTREGHGKIKKFLDDVRMAVGIQIDVESRFLKVEDNFLEDIGVDFRGLGNQAAEGVPGPGLDNINRSNAGFDDFGRRENSNPATPGQIGSGTEPGVFYDNGSNGDILGRTENLFDRTLGGAEGGLDNAGGFAAQVAFLDDTQYELVLRAVAKQERSEEITAPRLLVYNNKRAHMQVLRATSYIKDFDVEIAQAAAVANPVIDVVRDGVVLDVRPVVSADRRFITMELRPTVLTLQLPIPTFTTTLGVGQPISIQLPRVTRQTVRTTVTMPDGGTILLGGMNLVERQNMLSTVPILGNIPIISFLFSHKGTYTANQRIVILMRGRIILPVEHEPTELIPDASSMIMPSGTK